jgi:thiamine-phosphate pyrophosphorylase
MLALAEAATRVARAVGAAVFVNDRLDVAQLVEADGVHLGRRSVSVEIARRWFSPRTVQVSCSAHSVEEAAALSHAGADLVLLSPIFASPHKGAPLGCEALWEARRAMLPSCRLVALGGIDLERGRRCLLEGAHPPGADAVASIRFDLSALVDER